MFKKRKNFYCWCGLLFFQTMGLMLFSQPINLKFEHIGLDKGLSQSFVNTIFQDSRGFMWMGTSEGLNKYDGYKFTVYKNNRQDKYSITHNQVNKITEDNDGNIWVATWNGVAMFDRTLERFINYVGDTTVQGSISSTSINDILVDGDVIWLAADGVGPANEGGLNMLDRKKGIFLNYLYTKPATSVDHNVTALLKTKNNQLWLGTSNAGLNLFDTDTKTFTPFFHDENNPASIAGDDIRALFEDSRGNLWIGTRMNGLDMFDRKTKKFTHFQHNPADPNSLPSNSVLSIAEDRFGQLWIGTDNGGLSILNTQAGIFNNYVHDRSDPEGINSNSVYSIYRDRKGDMWLGTFSGGINFYSTDRTRFAHFKQNISNKSINNSHIFCIREDSKGNLLLATDGGGLNIYNPVSGTFSYYRHNEKNKNSIAGDHVLSVLEDSDHNIWVGTWGSGITVFNPGKNSYRHFKHDPSDSSTLGSNNAWTIYEDKENNIWIGTYWGGLNLFDKRTGKFKRFMQTVGNSTGINSNVINSILEDSDGNIWIGTIRGGLDMLDKKTGIFTHHTHQEGQNSISNDIVTGLFEDSQGRLWIGTSSGLNKLDRKTGKFTVYTVNDGLPHDYIRGMEEDSKGILWGSTNGGLFQLEMETGKVKAYGLADGLQGLEFKTSAVCRTRSGVMYFGGINGFNRFLPDSILRNQPYDPPIVFTDFQIFNKHVDIDTSATNKSPLKQSISETNEIVISYKESVITFEFASLNYASDREKQYSYKLEGFDKDWNDIGTKHSATYTNLDPGKYVLQVRGLNNAGKWSDRTAEMTIIITPPFWQTWWFRLLLLLAIVGGAVAFYIVRTNVIKANQEKLEKLVEEKTKQLEIKNRELEQFAYVASHDMQEPLRTTSSFILLLQQQYAGKLDEKADKYISYITHSTDRMKILIKDLLEFSRIGTKGSPEKVDCNVIMSEVCEDLTTAIRESSAAIKIGKLPVISGYSTEIKQLFQNLVINAIKFRKKNVPPEISVEAKTDQQYWQFSIKDNGIGIDPKHRDRIFIIFQRLHNRSEYEGSGIGLANCKKIVELHGGRIWIDSVFGQSTTFYFTIPVNSIDKKA